MTRQKGLLIFTVFGITGDLAEKNIIPAVFNLFETMRVPQDIVLVGNGRRPLTKEEFILHVRRSLEGSLGVLNESAWNQFKTKIYYVRGDLTDKKTFTSLNRLISKLSGEQDSEINLLFHLSVPPNLFVDAVKNLGEMRHKTRGWVRVLIEKPFGTNLASATKLNKAVEKHFRPEQIFPVDHYLGKETIENILAFRFANTIFESVWNKTYIHHMQITMAEEMGVKQRGSFYEKTGAIRDVVQNHLLQFLALAVMERPASLKAEDVQAARAKALEDLYIPDEKLIKNYFTVGQYENGCLSNQPVKSYREEQGVAKDSKTETFAAMKIYINNHNWRNIPIYVRAGKRLPQSVVELSILFKKSPKSVFQDRSRHNILTIRIQPAEGIFLRFDAQKPGGGFDLEPVVMNFCYHNFFKEHIEAYEQVIEQAYSGKRTWFMNINSVFAAWKFVDPFLNYLKKHDVTPALYKAGTWGPKEANELLAKDGNMWIGPVAHTCPV
ncbi:MAG: glucose-6-phosphate dehydrogenase [Patescibacteria group bacterium]|jgi:glucose-6-phosphate 1-dehydrogenase